MSEFEPMDLDNYTEVLANLKKFLDEAHDDIVEDFCDAMNDWLDDLLADDFFGTEGQCDPRGDHRD